MHKVSRLTISLLASFISLVDKALNCPSFILSVNSRFTNLYGRKMFSLSSTDTIQFTDNSVIMRAVYILLHTEQTTLHITRPLRTKNVKLEPLYLPCENMSAQYNAQPLLVNVSAKMVRDDENTVMFCQTIPNK